MARTTRIGTLVFLALAAACARPRNAALDTVRAAYREAAGTAEIATNAPAALEDAGEALRRTERAYADGACDADVNALAYVTQRRVDVARATAARKVAEAEIDRLSREREDVLGAPAQPSAPAATPEDGDQR
ncbi:MAG TPA: DUF4398 domain-containing protein [Candidatus Binatia bacterium]|nr:DUF4398 domain-containing protein [Candidatus Binatia bacterium]